MSTDLGGKVIGVICMYAAQRDLVRRTLMRSSLGHLVGRHIKIGTVDSYQGKENPITVVSLVRNNEDGGREGEVKMIKEGWLPVSLRGETMYRYQDGRISRFESPLWSPHELHR
jgi:superfamily I DNA and/or RNA helicase